MGCSQDDGPVSGSACWKGRGVWLGSILGVGVFGGVVITHGVKFHHGKLCICRELELVCKGGYGVLVDIFNSVLGVIGSGVVEK